MVTVKRVFVACARSLMCSMHLRNLTHVLIIGKGPSHVERCETLLSNSVTVHCPNLYGEIFGGICYKFLIKPIE